MAISTTALTVAEGSNATYTAKLTSLPTSNVVITPASNHTEVTFSPATLTFTTQNWNTTQTITVAAKQDNDAVADSATISHSTTSDDSTYNQITVDSVDVSVTEDDTAGVQITPTTVTFTEGSAGSYSVVLNTEPSQNVSVSMSSNNPEVIIEEEEDIEGPSAAVARFASKKPTQNLGLFQKEKELGSQQSSTQSASMTFTPDNWNIPQTVNLSAEEDDDVIEDSATITHNVSGYGDVTEAASVSVVVLDNDVLQVAITPTNLTIVEGESSSYTAVLTQEPPQGVTLTPSSDHAEITFEPQQVNFSVDDWSTTQTISVFASDDDDAAIDNATISHSVSANDLAVPSVSITVTETDTAGVTVFPTTIELREGESEDYDVVLTSEPLMAVRVTPSLERVVDVAFRPAFLNFDSSNWDQTQSITVTATPDPDFADEEATILHTLTSLDSQYNGRAENVQVTVSDPYIPPAPRDSPPISISLSVEPDEINEDSGTSEISVTATVHNGVFADPESLTISYLGDTAIAGEDFVLPANIELTIPTNATSATTNFPLELIDDSFDESDETLQVVGVAASGTSVSPATITIVDDDDAPTSIRLLATPNELNEADGIHEITITAEVVGGVFLTEQMVVLTIDEETAFADQDFVDLPPFELLIPPGEESADTEFQLEVINDPFYERDETLQVLGQLDSWLRVSPAVLTIIDDDELPSDVILAIEPSEVSEDAGVIELSIEATIVGGVFAKPESFLLRVLEDTAEATVDFVPPSPLELVIPVAETMVTATLAIEILDDPFDELDETLKIDGVTASGVSVEHATLSILDDDQPPEAIELTIAPMSVSEVPGRQQIDVIASVEGGVFAKPESIVISVAGDTANTGVDFSVVPPFELVLPRGESSVSTTLELEILHDTIDEPNETLILSGTSESGVDVRPVTLTIIDDDDPTLVLSNTSVVEGDSGFTEARMSITLSQPAWQQVRVNWITSDGDAQAGQDYVQASGVVSFAAGVVEETISLRVIGDVVFEGDEEFNVRVYSPENSMIGANDTATVLILDDDVRHTRRTGLSAALSGMARLVGSDAVGALEDRVLSRNRIRSSRGFKGSSASVFHGPNALPTTMQRGYRSDAVLQVGEELHLSDDFSSPRSRNVDFANERSSRGRSRYAANPWTMLKSRIPTEVNLCLSGESKGIGDNDCPSSTQLWARMTKSYYGDNAGSYRTDGDLNTGFLGFDKALNSSIMLGVALSHVIGDLNYSAGPGPDGVIDVSLTNIFPYGRVTFDSGVAWGFVGIGRGEVDLNDAVNTVSTNLSMEMVGIALRRETPSWRRMNFALKSDVFANRFSTHEQSSELAAVEVDAHRLRLLFEGTMEIEKNEHANTVFQVEAGGRFDGGTTSSGGGFDIGASLLRHSTASGFDIELDGRYTLVHQVEQFSEHSLNLTMSWDPGTAGLGFRMNYAPSWGARRMSYNNFSSNAMTIASPSRIPSRYGNTHRSRASSRYEAGVGYGLTTQKGLPLDFDLLFEQGFYGTVYRFVGDAHLDRNLNTELHVEMAFSDYGEKSQVEVRVDFGYYW